MNLNELPWDLILEILGFCIGLLYLWWEYHADKRLWYASVVMPMISMWIYFSKGLYADFAINIYYLVMAVYGFWAWSSGNADKTRRSGSKKKDELPISRITPKQLAGCTGAFILIWAVLYILLEYLTDSTVPIPDSFTTALSIIGTWMLARKYLEQWIAWILVDIVSTGLYFYKGIYFYSTLYLLYTVVAFMGYFKWKKLMNKY